MKTNSTINTRFTFDPDMEPAAKIAVIGVGGGGGNAVNNMIAKGIKCVDFVVINTDAQALQANRAPIKVQAGQVLTKGLGAGARPSVGAQAVEESRMEIEQLLTGYDMVFVTAGMGGGTGTGGAPIVAQIARKLGILTVGVVTKPFDCEGRKRMRSADEGIDVLRGAVDTLVTIPNERLFAMADDDITLIDAFSTADDVLYNATRGISDLVTMHGLINLDFADVRTTMEKGGTALMGSAIASGENRAERAAIEAISSPLFDGLSIAGATNALVNITAGARVGLREINSAIDAIGREAGEEVEIIFGAVIDEQMADDFRVTVVATGFDRAAEKEAAAHRVTRTAPRKGQEPIFHKGEENLSRLDTPAYERRKIVDVPAEKPEEVASTPVARIRRLDEPRDRPERIRKDNTETPAFLRRQMD